jgi:spore photoproduct lyase
MVERAARLGARVVELKSNRLGIQAADYVQAKTTLAVVTASESARKLQPIPPSADWQFHIAQGCPAHCQYCYLAGSLSGAPVTRAYANLEEILHGLTPYAGKGRITSASATRSSEGTTFEASCYTDPLGIEHLTGSLAECIRFFGSWDQQVQLRWTTKFDGVDDLLTLDHRRKTRVRFSVTARKVSRDFEGGTATLTARFTAVRKMALAGYPVGLTIAPIMPVDNWREEYLELLQSARTAVEGVPQLDLTVEAITHRFTPKSKLVQLEWYPKTTLDFDESARTRKMTKFGSPKFVYPKSAMTELRSWFEQAIAEELPEARLLYWT